MIRNIAFAICMLVYIGFPIEMISSYEKILDEGKVFIFQPRPIDPYNPFQGRYVYLNYGDLKVDYPQAYETFERDMKAYVSLKQDDEGFSSPDEIFPEAPQGKDYLEVMVNYVSETEVDIRYPFDEYYMNEQLAPRAEEEVRKFSSPDKQEVYVEVRVLEGQAIIEQLYVKGQPIEDFLRQQKNE